MAGCCCRMQLQFQWCHQPYSLEEEGTLPPTRLLSHTLVGEKRESNQRDKGPSTQHRRVQYANARTQDEGVFSLIYILLGLPDSYGACIHHYCTIVILFWIFFVVFALYLCFLKISTRLFWLAEEGTEPPSQTLSLSFSMTMQKLKSLTCRLYLPYSPISTAAVCIQIHCHPPFDSGCDSYRYSVYKYLGPLTSSSFTYSLDQLTFISLSADNVHLDYL